MADSSHTLAEPIFHEAVAPGTCRSGGKPLALLSLLIGLAFAALLSQVSSTSDGEAEDSAIAMAQFSPSAGLGHSTAPMFRNPVDSSKIDQLPLKMEERVGQGFGRREALAAGLASAAMLPNMAQAGKQAGLDKGGGRFNVLEVEDAEQAFKLVQDQNKAKEAELERQREKKRRRALGLDKDEEDAKVRNIGIALGAAALSIPLFGENLQRLFIKVGSGGEDDGYGKVPPRGGRRAPPKAKPKRFR
jgi:hypothetical protein